ncbi:pyruvate dehydrogenase (acetyl-transferring) E1 component subunit alpha [Spiractinospora alimapuensis]|uniref:thiamine pyrophosphate-dependent enzyme n=1 Tax=Spiractinospora alimapuensis TaxID=2820884 RepID=UPI001F34CEE0|nr:thiamine pyrophosphate-dependent enzyme [Spiractinospora alimapuensis]QVQ52027.1 pyruvate dehydrogenase (acetyl-transferring) E1 component subunit alpha [Spiractinospora alimapuensis]
MERTNGPRAVPRTTRLAPPEVVADPPLPSSRPVTLVDHDGTRVSDSSFSPPPPETLGALFRAMVIGRRFDLQASTLARQGRLAVYPSSMGQEACQVGGVLALSDHDWLFPTYRDSVAAVTHGIGPVEVLTLLRGNWHCGYDPHAHRCAPQCTPLATNASHAVGLTYAARRKRGEEGSTATTAALVLMGDGATSEGEAHEAYNYAAMWNAPVVFLVQNNHWAISVPVSKQSKAPTLAHKGVGYGMNAYHVDGNDAAAVYSTVAHALREARAGGGPALIEARTYRMEPHTNADPAHRYRDQGEVDYWRSRDPIERLETLLRAEGHLDDEVRARIDTDAELLADTLRQRMADDDELDPADLFANVYATPTPLLQAQRQRVARVGKVRR